MPKIILISLRLVMAGIMLWAFLDKVWGLGYPTLAEQSWLSGASPTMGFLTNGTRGPLVEVFKSMAGNPVVDWLFMMGLLGVGLAMLFGDVMKFAGYCGALMMLLIWLASFPPQHNPILDEHIVYILVFIGLAHSPQAGNDKFNL